MNRLLHQAMQDPDHFVIEMTYKDSKGNRMRRVVSPIRYAAKGRFLGLCLCREEPRQFYESRCEDIRLLNADTVQMPVPAVELATAQ